MKTVRILALIFLALATAIAGAAYWVLATYEPAPVNPAWAVESGAAEVRPGAVTVRFTGTSTLLFSDGETQWMTDGWFSRPGPLEVIAGPIAPDIEAIARGLERNRIESLAAVFPVHSHYDHAMDAPEVARRTGALLLGSPSTANIGRGWGLSEEQIRVVEDRVPIPIGQFTITPIESRHFQFPDPDVVELALRDPDIIEPLVPPVGTFEYKVGKAYTLLVEHPAGSWLIQGSAGFIEGNLEGLDVDVVFLGVGSLGTQTPDYAEAYWRETVTSTHPERVVLIHWDSLTGPAEGPFTGRVRGAAVLSGRTDRTREFLEAQAASSPHLEFWTLPRFDEVVLF
ncbi:MBL fold metallo-hydrolase [Myxococcota bacterium]|nr:MBL fold metallo-hydrolase [Myxococcota bacterium]